MIVDFNDFLQAQAHSLSEERRVREAVVQIESWWIRCRNRKIFFLLKEGICAAERTLTFQVLRKISPVEAELLNDPALNTRVRFRFGGTDFPPRILFKIFTSIKSCSSSIHYLSGKKFIKPGSKAAVDAGRQMGNRRLMEQLIADTCQQQGGKVTSDYEVTNLKELVQYRASLDETPAYLGGKDNTWRELDLRVLPRHHVMHDVSLYATKGVITPNLKHSFPKFWPHSPCQKIKQIRSLMNVGQAAGTGPCSERTRAPSSRKAALERARAMRELYLSEEGRQMTNTPEEEFSLGGQALPPDTECPGEGEWDPDEDEALSLYEWTQTLPVDVTDI